MILFVPISLRGLEVHLLGERFQEIIVPLIYPA